MVCVSFCVICIVELLFTDECCINVLVVDRQYIVLLFWVAPVVPP